MPATWCGVSKQGRDHHHGLRATQRTPRPGTRDPLAILARVAQLFSSPDDPRWEQDRPLLDDDLRDPWVEQ